MTARFDWNTLDASGQAEALRRPVSRTHAELLNKVRNAPGYRSSLESLVGSSGIATAQVTGSGGEVKVQGQVWDARAFDPGMIVAPGQDVEVYGLDGITLIVYPVDHISRQLEEN